MSDRRNRPADAALTAALAERMAAVLPPEGGPYPLHAPDLGPDEAAAVAACVASGWVSTAGDHTRRFEAMLAEATGAATSSPPPRARRRCMPVSPPPASAPATRCWCRR